MKQLATGPAVLIVMSPRGTIFWVATPASAGFLLGLLSDPEDGSYMFLRSVRFYPKYMALYQRRPHSLAMFKTHKQDQYPYQTKTQTGMEPIGQNDYIYTG
jgi:hypothetical protein